VNVKDEVLGSVSRAEAHSKGLLHRSGMVFVVNNRGQVLINKRSSEKETFPACYDSSASFHVTYGESYEESAKRELLEENRIDAPVQYLGKFIHNDLPEYQIVSVFLCTSDITPVVDPQEFSKHHFYSIPQMERLMKNAKITPWLRDGWKVLINHFTRS
jgi:isopentenyl-diphosphate delta-isomerase